MKFQEFPTYDLDHQAVIELLAGEDASEQFISQAMHGDREKALPDSNDRLEKYRQAAIDAIALSTTLDLDELVAQLTAYRRDDATLPTLTRADTESLAADQVRSLIRAFIVNGAVNKVITAFDAGVLTIKTEQNNTNDDYEKGLKRLKHFVELYKEKIGAIG